MGLFTRMFTYIRRLYHPMYRMVPAAIPYRLPRQRIPPTMVMYAKICDLSYESMEERQARLHTLNVPMHYRIIEEWSAADYVSVTNGRRVIIASRGTSTTLGIDEAIDDMAHNARVLLGRLDESSRVDDLQGIADMAIHRYGANNTILTGHSLGGSIVHIVAKRLKVDSFAFNNGASPTQPEALSDHRLTRTHRSFIVEGDAISAYELHHPFSDVVLFSRCFVDPHELRNFTDRSLLFPSI